MPKSENRIRKKVVTVRFSEDERDKLLEGAEALGLSLGAFIRLRTIGEAGKRHKKRPPADRAELTRLLSHLGKIGSNLNQMARRINSGGKVENPHLDKSLEVATEAMEALRVAIKK